MQTRFWKRKDKSSPQHLVGSTNTILVCFKIRAGSLAPFSFFILFNSHFSFFVFFSYCVWVGSVMAEGGFWN